jgi:hypothetical protein
MALKSLIGTAIGSATSAPSTDPRPDLNQPPIEPCRQGLLGIDDAGWPKLVVVNDYDSDRCDQSVFRSLFGLPENERTAPVRLPRSGGVPPVLRNCPRTPAVGRA